MTVSEQISTGVSEEAMGDINEQWRCLFRRWYEEEGTKSLRVIAIAPIANECGFGLIIPSVGWRTAGEGALPSLSRFGMMLRAKHRHVHAGLRLVSDRIDLGWSPKTTGSTYHLEPKDEPRANTRKIMKEEIGESEE